MSIINKKQLLELSIVTSDSIIPLWRFFPVRCDKTRKFLKNINIILVLVFVAFLLCIGILSAFPHVDFAKFTDGELIYSGPRDIINDFVLNIKWLTILLCNFLILIGFLVDVKDVISGNIQNRFHYYDPDHDVDLRTWLIVIIVLMGYVGRIWLFGICFSIGVHTANTLSVIYSGVSVYGSDVPKLIPSNLIELLLASLQNPIGIRNFGWGGTWQSGLTVTLLSLSRVILLTFLIGSFGLILRNLPPVIYEEDNQ